MQIGIRAHDLGEYKFEELVRELNAQGYACTHLALYMSIKEFSVDVGALTPGLAMYMKKIFAKYNVDVAVLGCYKNLANPDTKQLEKIIASYKAHIRFASILGCGVVGTETGGVNTEYKYEPANRTKEALEIFIKNLRIVVEYAEKMGVIIAIEPVWRHIVYNSERCREVLDKINSPNLQVIFDPVNVLNAENYDKQNEIISQAFELYMEEIVVLHAKDFIITDGVLVSVPAGQGMLNYDLIMSYIKAKKPYMHVTLEDALPGQADKAKQYIQDKYNKA